MTWAESRFAQQVLRPLFGLISSHWCPLYVLTDHNQMNNGVFFAVLELVMFMLLISWTTSFYLSNKCFFFYFIHHFLIVLWGAISDISNVRFSNTTLPQLIKAWIHHHALDVWFILHPHSADETHVLCF